MSPLKNHIMGGGTIAIVYFICIISLVSFFPTKCTCFSPHTISHGTSHSRLETSVFAFPDSRKGGSQEHSRSSRNTQQRKFKRTEDGDDVPNVVSDKTSFKPQTQSKTQSPTQPKRRFRSNSNSPHANSNHKNSKNNTNGRKKRRQNSQPQSFFTKHLISPPLQHSELPKNKNKNEEDDLILSPSVIQNNQQECMTYICGELPVTYTNDPKTLERWLSSHCYSQQGSAHAVLGFDVEAAPNLPWRTLANAEFENRPATVQLSTPYSSIVVHLTRKPKSHPRSKSILTPLKAMLADEMVLKVGAGIDEDMLELYRWNDSLDCKSRFDIGGIGSDSNRNRVGLQKLVRAIVGVELLKSKKIAMSDWSQIPLSTKQLHYASRDAWAGAAVMENIAKMYDDMQVDSIATMVREEERSMADVDMRAKTRKATKLQMKEIMNEIKGMSSYLGSGEKMSGKERHQRLLQIMPQETKAEMKRLQQIMEETSPDGLIFFDADNLGLDFTFVEGTKQ